MAATDAKDLEGVLLGCGNPLLDISAEVDESMLTKYGVTLNNAILAEEKHLPIYHDLVENHKVTYIAGGATQNSIRVAQWMLQVPGATSYVGAVGKDRFGESLKKAAQADGVNVQYHEDEKAPTGTCAVLVCHKDRSLITNLEAANTYKIDHMLSAPIQAILHKAKFYYIAGFFLTVSPDTIMHVAKHAHEHGKTFCMGLAAPFVCQFFSEPLMKAMPYIDVLIGNESEAKAFGEKMGYADTTPEAVAMEIYNLPKENKDKPRLVVITHGADPTVVVENGKLTKYPVPRVPAEEIVDANGAGDAFVGGLLSELIRGHSVADAVRAGHYSARTILGVSGCVLPSHAPKPKDQWPSA